VNYVRDREAIFAGFILLVGVIYEVMALRMPRGDIAYPGPGFYPMLVGIFLILTAGSCFAWLLAKGRSISPEPTSGQVGERSPAPGMTSFRKTMQLLALLVFYALTLKYLGFLLAIFIFMLASIRIFGYRRWWPSLGITAIIAAVSHLSFAVCLNVPLPQGIPGDIWERILG
jgi:hypothetical protein